MLFGANLLIDYVFVSQEVERENGLFSIDASGHLAYKPYANEGETAAINLLPDFSFAGYRGGGIPIPDVPVTITIEPVAGDNLRHVQDAITNVSALPVCSSGFRGAILLKSGLYEVNGTLVINASGVVLKGEHQGSSGTVIKAIRTEQHDLIRVQGGSSGIPEVDGTRENITTSYVPTGSTTFEVNDTSAFSAGDAITVTRTPNDLWIDELDMRQYGWTAGSYAIEHERTITSINGSHVTIDIPVVDPIRSTYGGGYIAKTNITGRISRCGIEDLRLESSFTHDEDENHGWSAIVFSRTVDSWARRVTARYFGYSCVYILDQSNFNTVEDCAQLDPVSITTGSRKYSFNVAGGLGNLFQRCYTRGGRHDFVTGARVTGPNVWLDCVAEETFSDIGPHHRWATGLLFDNIHGGVTCVQNRRAMGTGHGWAGAQTMFWNLVSTAYIKVESPKGAMNWGVGCRADGYEGKGYWRSIGNHVAPRSLYLEQLEARLGIGAVVNVTVPQQRSGTMYSLLSAWHGEGTPNYS